MLRYETGVGARPTVFIGGPLTSLLEPGKESTLDQWRQWLEICMQAFEEAGWRVLSAHQEEAWGADIQADTTCTQRDYRWMCECDAYVALLGVPASPGTHVELGWATALGKPTVILLDPHGSYGKLVTGLSVLCARILPLLGTPTDWPQQAVATINRIRVPVVTGA